MRIRTASIAAVLAALALVPALAGSAGGAASTTVKLGDNFFKPAKKVVRRGTVVRFRWVGRQPHNVTLRRGPGRRFASRTTRARGVRFAKRFRRRGTYRIVCTIHPATMRLKLRVR